MENTETGDHRCWNLEQKKNQNSVLEDLRKSGSIYGGNGQATFAVWTSFQ